MSTARLEAVATDAKQEIPMQPASQDIWDKKYRLKTKQGEPLDADIDDTYKRVARRWPTPSPPPSCSSTGTSASCGRCAAARSRPAASPPMPARRSTSRPPQHDQLHRLRHHQDSMDGILDKVHEAGLTLKAGCGIGYEFSTLRPRGAFVSGAGAYTSRPDVLHGYLRQDVLHRVLGRWPPRRADGHLRRLASGRQGLHPRQARGRPPAPVQPRC
jgi:ribonucleoside-diphosphate reductase alpha chain